MKIEFRDSDRDADADIAFAGERLQRDRVTRTADQQVAADAEPKRDAARGAGVTAADIARIEATVLGQYRPDQHTAGAEIRVKADARNMRVIAVRTADIRCEHATRVAH